MTRQQRSVPVPPCPGAPLTAVALRWHQRLPARQAAPLAAHLLLPSHGSRVGAVVVLLLLLSVAAVVLLRWQSRRIQGRQQQQQQ